MLPLPRYNESFGFGWVLRASLIVTQMMLITGPYLAFSPFLGTEKVEPNDYGRCFGLLATLFGVLLMEGTLLFSAENAFYSLQEMQKNVRLEIIETSDRRERQKLEYLLHDLHHLKPLSACNLFAIDKSIITSCLTIRYNSYSLLDEILIDQIILQSDVFAHFHTNSLIGTSSF